MVVGNFSSGKSSVILRKDLRPPNSLLSQFVEVRNLLAGQANGMTLDQSLVSQLIDLLLCKMHDERFCQPDEPVKFQRLPGETTDELVTKLRNLFSRVKRLPEVGDLFESDKDFLVSPQLLARVVEIFQPFEFTNAKRDVIGEAFESFIGPALRGNEGQFFTPRNVVELTCRVTNPKPGEIVLDPACGTGGYLTQAIRFAGTRQYQDREIRVFGIDKDCFLARVSAIQVGLLRKETDSWAFCANSLEEPHLWPSNLQNKVHPESIDVIMTNPPFGARISVGREISTQYHLGRIWKKSKSGNQWFEQGKFAKMRPPQILFIERCLNLLKPGGRLGIVVPDSILGNNSAGYVREYIRMVADVVAVIDLPLETFLPSTSTKTSLLLLRKKTCDLSQERVFMGIAKKCGHNRRGKPLLRSDGTSDDDFPVIAEEFRMWKDTYAPDF